MKTKFNKQYPEAYDIQIGSNGLVWGIWFKLPYLNKRIFKSFNEFQDEEGDIIERFEKLPNINTFLYEEERYLQLN